MAHEIPAKGGAEIDALSRWKKFLHWSPGERKALKRSYNKRTRQHAKRMIDEQR